MLSSELLQNRKSEAVVDLTSQNANHPFGIEGPTVRL